MFSLNTVVFVIFVFILLFLLRKYLRWKCRHFQRDGVCTLPYSVPFIGHMWKNVIQQEHLKDMVDRLYTAFPKEKYVGVQQLATSMILIRDPDLIKQIAIKDFDYLHDRVLQLSESVDPILGAILVALQGQKWRDMRATLSPAFTSSKMKGMFEFVEECALQMVDFFNKERKMGNTSINLEMKNIFRRYTNDVIASSAFGLRINSLEDVTHPFYVTGNEKVNFVGWKLVKFFFAASSPKLFSVLGLSVTDKSANDFYRKIVKDTMNERVEKNIYRPDMIHLLMEAKKGSLQHDSNKDDKDTGFSTVEESSIGKSRVKREWTDDQITAQAVLFLLAGFDTTANLLSFMIYELTIHPDIQKRLQIEIDEVLRNNDGRITYANINGMVYLDMIVSETLRKWPPLPVVDRKCVKPYLLPLSNDNSGKEYLVQTGHGIMIPIFSIHHDPKYYPDPEQFDPERFSGERRKDIKPNTYIPFGIGPRNCLGSRFALMESKIVVFHLLKNFDLVPCDKTEIPLKIQKNVFNLTAKNGFWTGIVPRE